MLRFPLDTSLSPAIGESLLPNFPSNRHVALFALTFPLHCSHSAVVFPVRPRGHVARVPQVPRFRSRRGGASVALTELLRILFSLYISFLSQLPTSRDKRTILAASCRFCKREILPRSRWWFASPRFREFANRCGGGGGGGDLSKCASVRRTSRYRGTRYVVSNLFNLRRSCVFSY